MSEIVASPVAISEALSSEPALVQSDRSEMVMDDSTMNHLTYKATNKVPYLIDYIGLRDFYESNEGVTKMAEELHKLLVIDDTETQIQQTKDELDALSQELNLQENDAPIYKLRKLYNMAVIKNRIATTEKRKLQMLADIERM